MVIIESPDEVIDGGGGGIVKRPASGLQISPCLVWVLSNIFYNRTILDI
jgi:hypothetical protein